MKTISFMTANFVARQIDYNMTEGWMQGDGATQDYFRPAGTFKARFSEYLSDAKAMGFGAVDIWVALLHPDWATPDHIRMAKDALIEHSLPVTSLAGGFGNTREELVRSCKLAQALDCTVLGGTSGLLGSDRVTAVSVLRDHGVRLAIENHPNEKTPADILAQIGDSEGGVIGTAVDTGWWGTNGYDAAKAIEELQDHLMHIHLKDVKAVGAHDTCRFGEGIVPVAESVALLKRIGYDGPICVEHEPEHSDPTADCIASREMLEGWLA